MIERSRPDGRVLELRRTALPGGGFVTLYADITARKEVEAAHRRARELAEAAAAEKSRFVAIVSHEIRTPLNVTLNALGLLGRSALDADQRRLTDLALQAGEALRGLLTDILDLSRMEVGQLAMRPGPCALAPLLEGLVAHVPGPGGGAGRDARGEDRAGGAGADPDRWRAAPPGAHEFPQQRRPLCRAGADDRFRPRPGSRTGAPCCGSR